MVHLCVGSSNLINFLFASLPNQISLVIAALSFLAVLVSQPETTRLMSSNSHDDKSQDWSDFLRNSNFNSSISKEMLPQNSSVLRATVELSSLNLMERRMGRGRMGTERRGVCSQLG